MQLSPFVSQSWHFGRVPSHLIFFCRHDEHVLQVTAVVRVERDALLAAAREDLCEVMGGFLLGIKTVERSQGGKWEEFEQTMVYRLWLRDRERVPPLWWERRSRDIHQQLPVDLHPRI